MTLRPPDASRPIEVVYPDGRKRTISSRGREFVVPVSEAGFYDVSVGAREISFSAHLTDAAESDLAVNEELKFADASVKGREWGGSGLGEIWFVALIAATLLLAVEWYLYHHRITV